MNTRHPSCRGSVMLEFVFTGIPMLFAVISLLWLAMGMWQYQTLAEAVKATGRYATVHGAGCAGQSCATTVDTVARALALKALGIPAGSVNVTLTSTASTVTCNPLSTCYGNAAAWPSLAANTAGSTDIVITAQYPFTSPISMWTPGKGAEAFGSVTLAAKTRQMVMY